MILRAAERSIHSPASRCFSARAGTRDLAVRDVADERCRKAYSLSPATDGRRSRRTNSLRSSAWSASSPRPVDAADRGRSAPEPEDLPEHGGVLEQRFSSAGSASSRAAIDPLHRSRGAAARPAGHGSRSVDACGRTPRRRAGCRRRAASRRACVSAGRTARSRSACDEPRRLVVVESGESESVVAFGLPPPQPGRRASSSGRAVPTTRSGTPRRPVDEVVDEVEQAVVGPVQVLEDEHERALLGDALEEPPPRGERLAAAVVRAARSPSSPSSGRRCRSTHVGLRFLRHSSRDARASLRCGLVDGVGLEDARLGLDHLAERPEA